MSDNAALHSKLLAFLGGQFALKDERLCIAVDLIYAPGNGYKPDDIRKWMRADEPDLFDNFANIEKLVTQIIEIAEAEADVKPAGKHPFYVRTFQHGGGRARQPFTLQPSYNGGNEETALMIGGGVGSKGNDVALMQILSSNNNNLMRVNTGMFDGVVRVLAQQNSGLMEQNTELHTENIKLRRENDELRSTKDEREFQYGIIAQKNARQDAGLKQLLQIGQVIVAKIAGGSEPQTGELPPQLALLGQFAKSLRRDQIEVFMNTLDLGQKAMFMQVMSQVMPQDSSGPTQGPPPGSARNAAPNSWVPKP